MLNKVVLVRLVGRVPMSASLSNPMSGKNDGLLLVGLLWSTEGGSEREGLRLILGAGDGAGVASTGSSCGSRQEVLECIIVLPVGKVKDEVLRRDGDWNLVLPTVGSWWIVWLGQGQGIRGARRIGLAGSKASSDERGEDEMSRKHLVILKERTEEGVVEKLSVRIKDEIVKNWLNLLDHLYLNFIMLDLITVHEHGGAFRHFLAKDTSISLIVSANGL